MSIELVLVILMIGGGYLVEVLGARAVESWLKAKKIEHRRGGGIINRMRNAGKLWRGKRERKEMGWPAVAYIGGFLASTGGIFLLLYLKAINRL